MPIHQHIVLEDLRVPGSCAATPAITALTQAAARASQAFAFA